MPNAVHLAPDGRTTPARPVRRLAAILAADIVGYGRLIGADEADTLARLRLFRREFIDPLVARHDGRVVKLTGDGALVEFASVVDAVECALLIQRRMARQEEERPDERHLRLRIGVNLGDVVVEDGDIYGDGVNIASRLEAVAEPGGVVVSRTVVDHVRGKLDADFRPIGLRRLKHVPEPVAVYRVRPGDGSGRPLRPPSGRRRRRWLLPAAVLLALILAGGLTLVGGP